MAQSTLQGILNNKCPRCRKGDMFAHSALNIAKIGKMHTHCPHCGFHYGMEPGFYYGAMYVSYAFSVAILMACGVLVANFVQGATIWTYLTAVTAATLLTFPFNFRFSRIIWLYLFVKYDSEAKKKE